MKQRALAKPQVAKLPAAAGRIPMPPGAAGPAPVSVGSLQASIVSALSHDSPSLMHSATVPVRARPSLLAVPTRPADLGSPERLRPVNISRFARFEQIPRSQSASENRACRQTRSGPEELNRVPSAPSPGILDHARRLPIRTTRVVRHRVPEGSFPPPSSKMPGLP